MGRYPAPCDFATNDFAPRPMIPYSNHALERDSVDLELHSVRIHVAWMFEEYEHVAELALDRTLTVIKRVSGAF